MLTYVSVLDIVYIMLLRLYQFSLKRNKSFAQTQAGNYQLHLFFARAIGPLAHSIPIAPDRVHAAIAPAEFEKYGLAACQPLPARTGMTGYTSYCAVSAEASRTASTAFFGPQAPFFDIATPWRYHPRWLPNLTAPQAPPLYSTP
jgi:hypothetical protein